MTGEKASGVISAFQLEQNGKIFWETKLPEFISSFDHLRLLLSSILAGILESNPENCMSFQEFVDQINLITSFSTIIIFCFYNSTYLKIYIDPKQQISDWFSQLKEKVEIYYCILLLFYRFTFFDYFYIFLKEKDYVLHPI